MQHLTAQLPRSARAPLCYAGIAEDLRTCWIPFFTAAACAAGSSAVDCWRACDAEPHAMHACMHTCVTHAIYIPPTQQLDDEQLTTLSTSRADYAKYVCVGGGANSFGSTPWPFIIVCAGITVVWACMLVSSMPAESLGTVTYSLGIHHALVLSWLNIRLLNA